MRSVGAVGGGLSLDALRDLRPAWRAPLAVPAGDDTAMFAPPPSVGSTVTAALVAMLHDRWDDVSAEERPHLRAAASARAFADRAGWMQPNGWPLPNPAAFGDARRLAGLLAGYDPARHAATAPGAPPGDSPAAAGFAVVDGEGQAVTCAVSPLRLFGAGLVAPGTGIVLANPPGPSGPPPLAVMMTVNPNTRQPHFVGAAAGGGTAPAALASVFLDTVRRDRPLAEAVAAPRLVHPGTPDAVFAETAPYALDPAPLVARGHRVSPVAMPSRVEALICREGVGTPERCEVATDPRGFGLATVAGKR